MNFIKLAKRLVAVSVSIVFVWFSLDRFVALKILENYHSDKVPEYWILYPATLFVAGVYFAACAVKARFVLWIRNES